MSYFPRTYYRFPGTKKWLDRKEFYGELLRRYENVKPEHLDGVWVLEELWFHYGGDSDLIDSCERPIKKEEKESIAETLSYQKNREFFAKRRG